MKKILGILFAIGCSFPFAIAQNQKTEKPDPIPKNWHHLDASSGFNGISLDKAYEFARAKKLKSNKVIVAVIDTGIDTLHEDLKPLLWRNPKEIPGNGIDDDRNGYADDIHGWNFLGGKDGRSVKQDSDEGARVYYKLKQKWEDRVVDSSSLNKTEKEEYLTYLEAKKKIVGDVDMTEINGLRQLQPKIMTGDSIIRKALGKEEYNANDLEKFKPSTLESNIVKSILMGISKEQNNNEITNLQIIDEIAGEIRKGEATFKAPREYRKEIVQDDESDINDRDYGNNDIMANFAFHGTHCAGIIAALRNNKGAEGIADNVNIMVLRVVPDGDEHDKDIALAIKYAVDHGAKVISMSFGKGFSPEKHWVDDAYRYAESKNVLLVHAAGNSAKDISSAKNNFPNPIYKDGSGRANNIITVGASGNMKNGGLTASFSNYSKSLVDVFAPGVNIYSTIPGGNTYGNASGTSMAAPVVAGIAALILQYYPNLNPQQVKYAIEKSAVAPTELVSKPGDGTKVKMSELSKTGGIVNAHGALQVASTLAEDKRKQKNILPKSKLIKKDKVG